ncbi:hypothetical protein WA026_011898 [Henosepilachna vigintioctopunctata]|uniref:ATP-binding cassette sub-family B member 6, mitochondrial n=1 Tax=Henosepilachna vigintioctopunctata TaxID=420089 RepID=A0AAW1UDR5_9CUCU
MKTEAKNEIYTNRSTWYGFLDKIRILWPCLWPRKNSFLQSIIVLSFILLATGRVVNLLVPIFSKLIVNSMSHNEKNISPTFRWDLILYYVFFKYLQAGGVGGMGLLNNLRTYLWIKVQQFTTREIGVKLLSHLHSLPLQWHLNRKTGEILRIMDRGTDSINGLLNVLLFNILPIIVDIIVAVIYFLINFDGYFALIVFVTMVLYIVTTITVTEWRTKYQRKTNNADNKVKAQSFDSLLNFETVKYYNNEKYEVEAYRKALLNFQKAEFKSTFTQNVLRALQNFIINGGLLIGSLLCLYEVVEKKKLTVGDYVLFTSYIVQLHIPLNFFGLYYRCLQNNFVDMERGCIKFDNVSFSYNNQPILKNVSFDVAAGRSLALVGPSGSGKSTIIRLLFKLFPVQYGTIIIDEQNIMNVNRESLRKSLGVVPQDIVLFNNSIKYNIQYGNFAAKEADIIEVARAADIHEKILSFKDSYEAQVGERGLRLSGGENQRIGIARTLLKEPRILLLDEATSALDTETERNIQENLKSICKNRTTIIKEEGMKNCFKIMDSILECGSNNL